MRRAAAPEQGRIDLFEKTAPDLHDLCWPAGSAGFCWIGQDLWHGVMRVEPVQVQHIHEIAVGALRIVALGPRGADAAKIESGPLGMKKRHQLRRRKSSAKRVPVRAAAGKELDPMALPLRGRQARGIEIVNTSLIERMIVWEQLSCAA